MLRISRLANIVITAQQSRSISYHSFGRWNTGLKAAKATSADKLESSPAASTSSATPTQGRSSDKLPYRKRKRRARKQESLAAEYKLPRVPLISASPRTILQDAFYALHRPLLAAELDAWSRQVAVEPPLQDEDLPKHDADGNLVGGQYDSFLVNEPSGASSKWADGTARFIAQHGVAFREPHTHFLQTTETEQSQTKQAFNEILGRPKNYDRTVDEQMLEKLNNMHAEHVVPKLERAISNINRTERLALEKLWSPLAHLKQRQSSSKPPRNPMNVIQEAEFKEAVAMALEAASFLPRRGGSIMFDISLIQFPDAPSDANSYNEADPAAILAKFGALTPASSLTLLPPPPFKTQQSVLTQNDGAATADETVLRTFQVEKDPQTGQWTAKELDTAEQADIMVETASGKSTSIIDLIKKHIASFTTRPSMAPFFSRSFQPEAAISEETHGRTGRSGRRLALGPRLLAMRGGRTLGRLCLPMHRLLQSRIGTIVESDSAEIIWVDSVKRKRKLKMNKHKYRKRRKANKAERKRLRR